MDAWHKAIASGDVTTALQLTAHLKTPDSKTTVLRNLGYEITGSPRNSKPPIITGVAELAHGLHSGATGGEHGVQNDDLAAGESGRMLHVI